MLTAGLVALILGLPARGHSPAGTAPIRAGQDQAQSTGRQATGSQKAATAAQEELASHLGRGYADLKSERYTDAVAEFRAALAVDPALTLRARFPLAVALFQLQKTSDARREFLAARSAAGDRPDIAYYLGRIDLLEGNAEGAIKELTRAAASPPLPDTAYYLGSAYLKEKQFGPAEKWLQAAAQLTPGDIHVQERLGLLYQETGRKPDSEKALAKAAELRQNDLASSGLRTDCAQKLDAGPIEEARAVCEKLFDANDPVKLTILGTLYGAHGDYDHALRPLRRAAELSPKSPQMQYNLALDYFRLKRFAEARAALEQVVTLWPDLFPINALLGATLYKLGDQLAAYQVLSHAHDLDSQDPATANLLFESALELAERSLASRDYQASTGYLDRAVELDPQDPEPHRLLAEAYRARGRDGEARSEEQQFQVLSARRDAGRN